MADWLVGLKVPGKLGAALEAIPFSSPRSNLGFGNVCGLWVERAALRECWTLLGLALPAVATAVRASGCWSRWLLVRTNPLASVYA